MARVSNSILADADASLRNVETNQPIDGFRRTLCDIASLTGRVDSTRAQKYSTDCGFQVLWSMPCYAYSEQAEIDTRRKRLWLQIGPKGAWTDHHQPQATMLQT
jgi:hypothetical protein